MIATASREPTAVGCSKCHGTCNENHAAFSKKNTDSQVIRHVSTPDGRKYVISWYGYDWKESTLEPPDYIPSHSIKRNWKRLPGRCSYVNENKLKSIACSPTNNGNRTGWLLMKRTMYEAKMSAYCCAGGRELQVTSGNKGEALDWSRLWIDIVALHSAACWSSKEACKSSETLSKAEATMELTFTQRAVFNLVAKQAEKLRTVKNQDKINT